MKTNTTIIDAMNAYFDAKARKTAPSPMVNKLGQPAFLHSTTEYQRGVIIYNYFEPCKAGWVIYQYSIFNVTPHVIFKIKTKPQHETI